MDFIEALEEPRRSEIAELHELIRDVAPELEVQATDRMIGYGPYHYRYASGREGDSYLLGLAPNKAAISIYVQCTKDGAYLAESYADRLGKANVGKACVRFKRPSDLDLGELRALLAEAVRLGPPA
ncbi:DUF1801 domain-containing protein [Solirubrobacter soli]|uniref:DUF1801 domain-containing protein n=1 Tax=Solirubrobacter soli TaxID=363832 RepID=UPI000428DBAE|nr:DUF1801 domain-containing protein [Solirubrobacter soli]